MAMIYRVRGNYFTNLQQAMVMAKNYVEDQSSKKIYHKHGNGRMAKR